MTTTTDSAGHPDVTELSDLTEGLLSPSRTRDVRQHLDDCALCTDVYDSLEEIRGMLGTLPGPPRMPADVAERIDAALAAEALLNATAPSVDVSRETSTTASSKTTKTSKAGKPAPAESATPSAATHAPAGHARAATGPGRGGRTRGRRRRTTVIGAVFTAAALGLGSLLVLQPWESDSSGSTETASGQSDTATFSKGKLKSQVADLLAKDPSVRGESTTPSPTFGTKASPDTPSRGSSDDGHRKGGPAYVEVPACIEQGIGLDGRAPLAADQGTYEGKDAYLVVVTHETDSTKVSAYIVDAACVNASAAPGAAGKVLLTQSYPRG
ncbi:anti-sigma factor family protein [Streptomyces sp. NPDC059003]|uniref:anti-sigma factor family protein n=1 Tax=Streptomyces sp. NPDC059003 TaxID=3346691 RepID=UPI0036AE0738